MKALIACEESQAVCKEFRKLGHEAYSCDIQECSGGHPEWHLQGDAIHHLWKNEWDLVIAHPPCTYLANSGVRWLVSKKYGVNQDRLRNMVMSANFFKQFVLFGKTGGRIAIENPIMHKHAKKEIFHGESKPDQIIQPWQFGHGETKATCLWLYNLPLLTPTNIVDGREPKIWKMSPGPERAKLRSKTFPGIAQAMAEQWGKTF